MDTQTKFFRRFLNVVLAAAAAWVLPSSPARAGWKEMAARLPAQTNAIVAINVDAVMRAPLAVQENWPDHWADAYEAGPVPILPGTQRILAGAFVKQGLQETDWRVTIMETKDPVLLEEVGRSQGGYAEKVWTKMCVVAPTAYFVSFDPKTLASYAPPNRQSVFGWVCDCEKTKGMASESLRGIVSGLGGVSHIVMAIDTAEQYSASGIRAAMGANPLSRIDSEKTNLDKLAHVLAGIKYVALNVRVTDKLQAAATVQLSSDGEWFGTIVKAVIPEVLDRAGISLPEVENWTVKVDGNRLTLAGDISVDSMRDLLSILGLLTPTKAVAASDDPAVIGRTSRTFYRTICASLDSYPKTGSYERVITWVRRETAKMERLPLTNVDPELVAWSTEITKRLREVAVALGVDRQTVSAAVIGIQNPGPPGGYTGASAGGSYGAGGGNYYYGYDGSYTNRAAENAVAQENAARQRMQVVKQQQAQSLASVAKIMGDLASSRNALRAKMAAKYKMEF